MEYIYIFLFTVFFGLLAASPVLVLMFVINRRQKKYFHLIAEKYQLEEDLGKRIFIREFPLIKGYINQRWFYMIATTVNRIDRSLYIRPVHNLKQPTVQLSMTVNNPSFSSFLLRTKKDAPKNSQLSFVDFNVYFSVQSEPQHEEKSFLNQKIREKAIEYCEKYGSLSIALAKNELICYLPKELTREKRYREVLVLIELLILISEEIGE